MRYRFQFILGCQRSGTTALVKLLNQIDGVILGVERFKYCQVPRNELFSPGHFFSPSLDETNLLMTDYYYELKQKFEQQRITVIGDKNPGYVKKIPAILEEFDNPKFLFTIRPLVEVAASYNYRAKRVRGSWPAKNDYRRAVRDWHVSLNNARDLVSGGLLSPDNLFLVSYEDLWRGDVDYLSAIARFMGVELSQSAVEAFSDMTKNWSRRREKSKPLGSSQTEYVEHKLDQHLWSWACATAAEHRRLHAGV